MMIDSSYDFLRFYLLSNMLTPKISTTEYSLEGYMNIVKESFSVSFILSATDLCTSDQHNRLGLLFLMLSFKNIICSTIFPGHARKQKADNLASCHYSTSKPN